MRRPPTLRPRATRVAIGLAAAGCVAAFYGASELLTHRFVGPETLLPLLVGLALIVVLVVNQYRSRRPLLTIRTMLTSTIPVAGIVARVVGRGCVGLGDGPHRRRARTLLLAPAPRAALSARSWAAR